MVPAFILLTIHWYDGVEPPLTGVALNVTAVPAQISPGGLAAMLTLTGRFGLTIIVIAFDVAGFPLVQVASEFRIQVMISPLTGK